MVVQVKKMVQFVVEEVAGLALDASRMDNLKKLTIVAWEDLFVRIKDGKDYGIYRLSFPHRKRVGPTKSGGQTNTYRV